MHTVARAEDREDAERNAVDRLRSDPAHIVLAEDDPALRQFLAAALRFDGFQVIETSDGNELIDRVSDWMLHRWPYEQLDLIVSDVRMPGLSGTDAVARMRAARWTTPVILLTAYADPRLECEARGLDVDAVFLKPFDIDDLRTAALNAVDHRRATRAALAQPTHPTPNVAPPDEQTPTNDRLEAFRRRAIALAATICEADADALDADGIADVLRGWADMHSPEDAQSVAALGIRGTISRMRGLIDVDDGALAYVDDGHPHTLFQHIARHARALAEFAEAADALCDVPMHRE